MTRINAATKRGKAYINQIDNARIHSLYECYANPSYAKRNAYEWCLQQYFKDNGINFSILGFNCNDFTVGWKIDNFNSDNPIIDEKTGEIAEYVYRVETYCNSYIIY